MTRDSTERSRPDQYRHGEEEEANYLIPKGMHWFDDGGCNVPYELLAVAQSETLPHASIVTKAAPPPAFPSC
jgi:hypothetical protein